MTNPKRPTTDQIHDALSDVRRHWVALGVVRDRAREAGDTAAFDRLGATIHDMHRHTGNAIGALAVGFGIVAWSFAVDALDCAAAAGAPGAAEDAERHRAMRR